MKRNLTFATPRFILCLVVSSLAVGTLFSQERYQIKEPPLPVVLGTDRGASNPDEPFIMLSVPDFNYIMEREDSLRRTFSTQITELRTESDRKSILVYGLAVGLVFTNFISISVARKRRAAS